MQLVPYFRAVSEVRRILYLLYKWHYSRWFLNLYQAAMHFSVTSFFKTASFRFLSMQLSIYLLIITVWHEIFARVYFCGLAIFLCLTGTRKFLWLGQIGFSRWDLIFAIFRKYPVPSINNIFVFVKYIEIHISFPNTTTVCVLYVKPAIQCPRRDFAQRRNPEEAP